MRFRSFLALMTVLLFAMPARALTREEVRERYAAISDWTQGEIFVEEPAAQAPYAAGAVEEQALADALAYLNFLRALAGVAPVELDANLTSIAQYGAVLSAANGYVSHDPPAPADMDAAFYEKARYAAQSCNIARLNWSSQDVLREAVAYFVRDDGEENLATLGHRRWALNPMMGATGFGLATDAEGASYATMYAHDLQGEAGTWKYVAWPSAGAFPAELMNGDLAWSISVAADWFDTEGAWVRLSDAVTGAVYEFPGEGGYFYVDEGAYGAGACLIFRPEGVDGYAQNQVWRVEAGNASGQKIAYEVEMISLYPIEPSSVEVSPREANLRVGQALRLEGAVVPQWADEVELVWESTDPSVATVEDGEVLAVGAGECEIRAVAVNGRADACKVTVTP